MKQKITKEEYSQIEDQANSARYFLNSPRFQFIRDYLSNAQDDIEKKILNNTIREVKEEHTISDKLKRVFITPKKTAVDELSGAYKFINQFMQDMEQFVNIKKDIEQAELDGKVLIEKSKEK